VTDLQEEITTIRRAFKEFIEDIKFDCEETESDSLASYIWKRVEKYEGILNKEGILVESGEHKCYWYYRLEHWAKSLLEMPWKEEEWKSITITSGEFGFKCWIEMFIESMVKYSVLPANNAGIPEARKEISRNDLPEVE
jgi:hypothetical protein